MTTIEKTVSNEIRKWMSFDMNIYFINNNIRTCYYDFFLGDYDVKKSLLLDYII